MPVHNSENYVQASLNSIIDQTYDDFEIILIDDNSQDKTLSIVKSFKDQRIKIIRNKRRRGVAGSLNIGLKYAKGEYIARMDSDDIARANRFKEQVRFLDTHPEVILVGSWVNIINENGKIISEKKQPVTYESVLENIMKYNPFIHSTVMFRKNILLSIGAYENDLDGAEDYDLFLRVAKKYPVCNIPKKLLSYRVHKGNITLSSMKRVERAALQARVRAITQYGYPIINVLYLIKPFFSYLIPAKIKTLYEYPHALRVFLSI